MSKYNWYNSLDGCWGSPHATTEGVIDVVNNVRTVIGKPIGKTGSIGVRHFEDFSEVLGIQVQLEVGKGTEY